MEKKLKNRNTAGVFAVAVIYAVFKIGLMHGAPFHGFSDAFMNMIYSPASVEGALLSFVIALILPMALQILTASCVTEDLSGAVVYILPRAGTLRRWFFGKVRQLLSACTAAVSTVTLCIGGYSAYRYGMPSKNDWRILLTVFGTTLLFCFCAVLFVNVLSVAVAEKWAGFAGLAGMLLCAAVIYPTRRCLPLLLANPIYNYFVLWRKNAWFFQIGYDAEFTQGDFLPVETAVLLFAVCAAAEILIGLAILRKKDFLSCGR